MCRPKTVEEASSWIAANEVQHVGFVTALWADIRSAASLCKCSFIRACYLIMSFRR